MGVVEESDELGADDGTGCVTLGCFKCLLVADTETYHTRIAEVHAVDATEVLLLGIVERLLGASDGGTRYHVDEAVGVLVDEADAVVAGLWRDEHDDAEVVAIGDGLDDVLVVVEGEVGDDHAANTGVDARLTEGFDAVVEDGIEIAHEDEGNLCLVLDGFQLGEEFGEGHAVFEGLSGGTLDDGAVGQGVAEWDADLDEVDAAALHGEDDVGGAFECGAASTEVERKEFFVFWLLGKELIDLICHNSKTFLILICLLFPVQSRNGN